MSENKSPKRVEFEKSVYEIMDALDPTGYNSARYRDYFNSLSNKQFDDYVKKLMLPEYNLHVELSMYGEGKEKPPTFEQIEKIANKFGVPLMEYMFMPYANPTDPENPVVSPTKVLMLVLLVRKMQQMLSKKNSISGDTDVINPLTGQVTGSSKSASLSDTQTNALVATKQYDTVAELLSLRGDDEQAERVMLTEIANSGECHLDKSKLISSNKRSLRTVHTLLLGAGLVSDILKRDIDDKKSKEDYTKEELDLMFEKSIEKLLEYRDIDRTDSFDGNPLVYGREDSIQTGSNNALHSSMYKYEDNSQKTLDDQEVRRMFDKNKRSVINYINAIQYYKDEYKGKVIPHNITLGRGLDGINLLFGFSRYKTEAIIEAYNKLGCYQITKSHILKYTGGRHNKFGKDRPGQVYIISEPEGEEIARFCTYFDEKQLLNGIELFGTNFLFTLNRFGIKSSEYRKQSDAGIKIPTLRAPILIKVLNLIARKMNMKVNIERIAKHGKIFITCNELGFQAIYKNDLEPISFYFFSNKSAFVRLDEEKTPEEVKEMEDNIDKIIEENARQMPEVDNQTEYQKSAEALENNLDYIEPEEFDKYRMLIFADNHLAVKKTSILNKIIVKYQPAVILHQEIPLGKVYTKPDIDREIDITSDGFLSDIFTTVKLAGYPLLVGIGKNAKDLARKIESNEEFEERLLEIIDKNYLKSDRSVVILRNEHLRMNDSAQFGEASIICTKYAEDENVLIVVPNEGV